MQSLQADDVGREHAVHDLVPHVLGQHFPVLGRRPRYVHVVLQDSVGQLATHQARDQVKVVVMREHEGALTTAAGLANNLVGKHLVDRAVALIPGAMGAVIQHRCLGQVPEVVLHEPEQRVGDGVVVEVVGELRRIDPADLETRAIDRLHQHRLTALSQVELALEAVPHGGHPYRTRCQGQPRQTGHQAAPTADEALTVLLIAGQVDGCAVGGHDRIEVLKEPPGVLLDGQH